MFVLGMFAVPESPRWLAKNGKQQQARGVLTGTGNGSYASAALVEIEATLVNESEKVDFRELLHPKMARVLVLGGRSHRVPAMVRHQRDPQLR